MTDQPTKPSHQPDEPNNHYFPELDRDADCAFIVRACNSHAALVAALETVERAFVVDNEHPWIPGAIAPAIRAEVRAALVAARQ